MIATSRAVRVVAERRRAPARIRGGRSRGGRRRARRSARSARARACRGGRRRRRRSRSARRRSGSAPGPCRRRTRWSAARWRPRSRRRGPRSRNCSSARSTAPDRAGRAPRTRCRSRPRSGPASASIASRMRSTPRRADARRGRRGRSPPPRAARQLGHVLARVAVLGHRLAAHPRGDRLREAVDLAAPVVDVVLALHPVPANASDPRHRVAVGGVAAAGRGQRPGRVRRDELDHASRSGPVGAAGRRTRRPAASSSATARRYQRIGEEEVEEAGTGDLDPLQAAAEAPAELSRSELGDLPRLLAAAPARAASPRWSSSRRTRASGAARASASARPAVGAVAQARRRPPRRRARSSATGSVMAAILGVSGDTAHRRGSSWPRKSCSSSAIPAS